MKRLLTKDAAANKRTYFQSDAEGNRAVTGMDVTGIKDTSRAEVIWLETTKSIVRKRQTFRCRFISSF